jgi:hypothetical protein
VVLIVAVPCLILVLTLFRLQSEIVTCVWCLVCGITTSLRVQQDGDNLDEVLC